MDPYDKQGVNISQPLLAFGSLPLI